MASVEIFGTRNCPFVHRSRLVMTEKGIDFDFTIVDTKNKADWFLEISPYGKVPVVKHDGNIIYESAVINEYLNEVFEGTPLMPSDPGIRAHVRIWIDYSNSIMIPAFYGLQKSTPENRNEAREKAVNCFRFMEEAGLSKFSGDGPYWFGAEPTLADFAFYPFFERLPGLERYRGLSVPDDCPRLKAWFKAMSARPAVKHHATPAEAWIETAAKRYGETPAANAAE